MKMKRIEMLNVYNDLPKLKNLEGVKLAYAIIKNSKKLESEIEILRETAKPSNRFNEYESKRVELCKLYCKKDDSGNPMNDNGYFVGLEQNEEFKKRMIELQEEYKDEIISRQQQINEYNSFLNSEADIDFHSIKLEDLPHNVTVEQMSILEKFIE